MKQFLAVLIVILSALALPALAQQDYDFSLTTATDTFQFWARTPAGYDSTHPPAIVVWWHGYGGDAYEMRNATPWINACTARGWMAASMRGPFAGKHYQGRRGQHHMDSMLTWAMSVAPFSLDSVYMIGSSMGAAGGQVWHNNHCGIHDFMCAAQVGGSPILDCELRQQQYVDSGHTLDAMRAVFGGWPASNPNGYPWDNDSIAYEYHRASAVRISDTTRSMHFNSLHLPVYYRWGTTDNAWNAEWFAYGRPAQALDTLRQLGGAEVTDVGCSGINSHGYPVLTVDSVYNWLSGRAVNRYPRHISINADEDDEYYWTRVRLDTQSYTMGRYGVDLDPATRHVDISLVRNIHEIEVECLFPWPAFDSLVGHWVNMDSVTIPSITVKFSGVPSVATVLRNGTAFPFTYADSILTLSSVPPSGDYSVRFATSGLVHDRAAPAKWQIVSAYPNPFNSQIALDIESALAGREEVRLYDITGRLAKTLTANLSPGTQRILISGDGLASGIYFIALPHSGQAPLKVVLLK